MMRRILLAGIVAAVAFAASSPAWAAVSITVSPTASISWTLASTGPNTRSGGTMTVNATEPYTVSLTADKTRLSEWDTGTSAYVSGGKALGAALGVGAARTGGTATVPGVGASATIGATTILATGTGIGTDTYAITLSQPTAITDPALPAGRTYHIVLTYTASPTL